MEYKIWNNLITPTHKSQNPIIMVRRNKHYDLKIESKSYLAQTAGGVVQCVYEQHKTY